MATFEESVAEQKKLHEFRLKQIQEEVDERLAAEKRITEEKTIALKAQREAILTAMEEEKAANGSSSEDYKKLLAEEKALKGDSGKSIDLDKAEDLDRLMETYVAKKFRITQANVQANLNSKNTELVSIRWVGHERNLKKAWLYFEIPGDKVNRQWKVENRVFFELNEDQLNHVDFKYGNSKKVLISRSGQASHHVDASGQGKLMDAFTR